MSFEKRTTEADFQRALLESDEEQQLRRLQKEPDLTVDGLERSLLARLLQLFSREK